MDWLPKPADFLADLRAAIEANDPEERLHRIVLLAGCQLGFVETIQLGRAIDALAAQSVDGLPSVRVAILASNTVEHLIPALRVAGLRRRLLIDVHTGAYGQYRQELFDTFSALHRFRPQICVFCLSARDLISNVPLTATSGEVDQALAGVIESLRLLWQQARETFRADLCQQTFLDFSEPLFGSFDRLVPGAPSRLIACLNDRLAEAAVQEGIALVDIAQASNRDGRDLWFDNNRWLQAKQEISPPAASSYGELLARVIAAQRGLSKKCLVLDLDNTLWGGVVGDDGIHGIVLGQGSAVGEAHLALQQYAKQLHDRGVILAVCSKNDLKTAEAVFEQHPEMLLKRPDIAVFCANWDDKVQNLRTIAHQLNIGVDSLVFVDDNPAERERIRAALPLVAVPELPHDVSGFVRCLAAAGYFEAVAFTAEDSQRADQYAANAARESMRVAAQSMDDFLEGLAMSVHYGQFASVDLARLVQLINKTNQFNVTTRRYTAEEVTAFREDSTALTLQFRLTDKFGDNGLVSAMIFRRPPEQTDALELDTWVMSCRVFGRQLEHEALNIAVEAARKRDVRAIVAEYIPTAKNGVVSDLFRGLGFTQVDTSASSSESTRWRLRLEDYVPKATHIAHRTG